MGYESRAAALVATWPMAMNKKEWKKKDEKHENQEESR